MEAVETLFSLEVAVECMRVQSSTVACRFPAIAFRLLDFPTLIVHHVESGDTGRIKDSVFIDQELNGIPLQLHELKDHRGNFIFKKGKSCMFKMNLTTLQMHLRNTPLYVMLVDTWPEVPKLVANCTVSLQDVIENICADVQKCGIEVPSVHGVRGSYKLCNLMGTEIGWVVLGLRLLSLGASLMSHIPQTALVTRRSVDNKTGVKVKKTVKLPVTPRKSPQHAGSDDIVVEDIEVASVGVAEPEMPKPKLTFAISTTEMIKEEKQVQLKNNGTQTVLKSKKLKQPWNKPVGFPMHTTDQVQDSDLLIVSNTHCPPPLYFNADLHMDNEINHQSDHKIYSRVNEYTEHIQENEIMNSSVVSSITASSSSETTINSRAQYTETHYKYQSAASGERQSMSVRKTHRKQTSRSKHQLKSSPRTPKGLKREESSKVAGITTTANLANHNQMPILTALLQELSLLHGNVLPSDSPLDIQPQFSQEAKHLKRESISPKRKENLQEADFSVPNEHTAYRHKHADCTRTPRGVPSKKGWLRKEPRVSKISKTKLRYGMTNTQKLRLQKNNPELLKHMEKQAARVKSYRKNLDEKVQKKKEETALDKNATGEADISTEISHQVDCKDHIIKLESHEGGMGDMEAQQAMNVNNALRLDLQDVTHVNAQNGSKKRKPVPTPRTPHSRKGDTFKWSDVDSSQEKQQTDKQKQTEQKSLHAVTANDDNKDGQSSSETSAKSASSIDVYLPKPAMEESFLEDEEQQSLPNTQIKPFQKTVAVPGFPSMSTMSSHHDDNMGKTSFKYSDDFDSSKNFESTGEQELHHLSKSTSERSSDTHLDSSGETHSSQSVTSLKSKVGNTGHNQEDASRAQDPVNIDQKQPGRLHAGFAMPKPLMSTKSPVPVAVRRSSRPSLQIQPSVDIPRAEDVRVSPPTPKPRLHLQQTGSTMSTSSQLPENFSSSEFSTKGSEQQYRARSESPKKEFSDVDYSDKFDSSNS